MGMGITVVIPMPDEASNIGWVLERLPDPIDEVILVDGRSIDGTIDAARAVRPDVREVIKKIPGKRGRAARGARGCPRGCDRDARPP
jgi:glycosyltransferase involved in cell wall biosynthesis